jgi:predicted transcriptional regulator
MRTFSFRLDPSASLNQMFNAFEEALHMEKKQIHSDELISNSIETILAIMTRGKLELFCTIAKAHPESLYALAQAVGRDPGNVFRDVKSLEALHLIALEPTPGSTRDKIKPLALYDRIIFDFGSALSSPKKSPTIKKRTKKAA